MLEPLDETIGRAVYRRVAPPHFKVKKHWVDPDAFTIQPWMKGLSVYSSDIASPFEVLQTRLDEARANLQSEDPQIQLRASKFLANNPDVETLVEKSQYRIVEIPIAAIMAMGFRNFEKPDSSGHLNIVGSVELFDAHAEEFVGLIDSGQARILSIEECMRRGNKDSSE